MKNITKSILFLTLSLLTTSLSAQNLLISKPHSTYTYIYKISNEEALSIYTKKWNSYKPFFHEKIDSFPTHNTYGKKLPQGHYIKVFTENNKENVALSIVQNFSVFVMNNNKDFNVKVTDLQGKTIDDASIKINSKKISYNPKTQLYTLYKSNKKGLLQVTVDGFSAFYNLNRSYNNSRFKRISNTILSTPPFQYIWVPLDFAYHLPKDSYNSLINGYSQGNFFKLERFFRQAYFRIACLFDSYYCDKIDQYTNTKGYVVFSKPKYKPRDTVKLKAFLTNKKGKPLNKTMHLNMYVGSKKIHLGSVKPYRKGAYTYSFPLHDSLQLKLDKNYFISFEHKGIEYYSKSFKYEDYELKGNSLYLNTTTEKHYRGKTNKIYIEGKDINDIPIQDGRLEISLTKINVTSFFDKRVFVPDTLLFLKRKLDVDKETSVSISDSIFPAANLAYKLHVRLLTSDNESIDKYLTFLYVYKDKYLDIKKVNDSLLFRYFEDSKSHKRDIKIYTYDNFGNKNLLYKGSTPIKEKINPYFASYQVETDSIKNVYELSTKPANIQCFSERTADSIHIIINNPDNIPFHYNIYKKNKLIHESYDKTLKIHEQSNSGKTYFLVLNYIWGGKSLQETYNIPFKERKLNLEVIEPKIILPGQKANIEIRVTNAKGKPVENVDITAFSLNKKFNYEAPILPQFNKNNKGFTLINNFNINSTEKRTAQVLDYQYWKKLAHIDSIAYYQFIYPGKKIYKYEVKTTDATTQFAPFVFNNGESIPIHIIEVDHKPIYYSWTNKQAYSFMLTPGYHHISLRTTTKTFMLDNIFIKRNHKLIFSLDEAFYHSDNSDNLVYKSEDYFTKEAKKYLKKYMLPYRKSNVTPDSNTYLISGNSIQKLTGNYYGNNIVGPFSGNLNYLDYKNFNLNFIHEYGFEYEFSKKLLKMRSVDLDLYFPKKLKKKGDIPSIHDLALTTEKIHDIWKNNQISKRKVNKRYNYPTFTQKNRGKLIIKLTQNIQPINLILFKHSEDDFVRIYSGKNRVIHNLKSGLYKLILLNQKATYNLIDSINIHINGTNYIKVDKPISMNNKPYIKRIDSLLTQFYQKPVSIIKDEQLKKEQNSIIREHQFSKGIGNAYFISGTVTDEAGPLPGVSVLIKGTDIGTETDFDGHYTILVHPYDVLQFSFIGMKTINMNLGYKDILDITMQASEESILDEVVVTALGIRQSKNIGLNTKTTHTLSGKASGVQIGSSKNMIIRGLSSSLSSKALILIDGIFYQGKLSEIKPDMIENIQLLKGKEATMLYGSQAIHGVILITSKKGSSIAKQSNEIQIMQLQNKNSIRNNFRDEAFWKPKLRTNKDGKVQFMVQFPDDITTWKTLYLAMNSNKQTGATSGEIKAFKRIMAQLYTPRFLIEGDSSYCIGKIQNLNKDSIKLNTVFKVNTNEIINKQKSLKSLAIDSLMITTSKNDSLNLEYYIKNNDEIIDGERKKIPVLKKGLLKTQGAFFSMRKDTTFSLNFNKNMGNVYLHAETDLLDVLEEEIRSVEFYKYDCNEQLASKLKMLLSKQKIASIKNVPFKQKKKTKKIIRQLLKYKHTNGLWGWWHKSNENKNISYYILETLIQARNAGYSVKLNDKNITDELLYRLHSSNSFEEKIHLTKILKLLNITIDYNTIITNLSKKKSLKLYDKLALTELKQMCMLPYSLGFLEQYKKQTLFGNLFYSENNKDETLWNNEIQSTIIAYKLLRNENRDANKLLKIRSFFLEERKNRNWRNTLESSKIVETILPDILKNRQSNNKTALLITGGINKSVTSFPFSFHLNAKQNIQITKQGDYPIYFTYYQKYWDQSPQYIKNNFEVNSYFEDNKTVLNSGNVIQLITEIKVRKDAKFVMLNIPIPAGCSYNSKEAYTLHETHRAYQKNETTIFFEYLPAGNYKINLDLIARYKGKYNLNPAMISLMYYPTFNANDNLKTISIQ